MGTLVICAAAELCLRGHVTVPPAETCLHNSPPPEATLVLLVTLDREPGSTDDMIEREVGALLSDNLADLHHVRGYRINRVVGV